MRSVGKGLMQIFVVVFKVHVAQPTLRYKGVGLRKV